VKGVSLTIRKLNRPPVDRWCQGATGGHRVAIDAEFKNDEIKFFTVSGNGLYIVLCEPCLVVAQALARKQKRGF